MKVAIGRQLVPERLLGMAGGQEPFEVSRPPSKQASSVSVVEPEKRRTAVAIWLIRTPPGGRLVYHRIRPDPCVAVTYASRGLGEASARRAILPRGAIRLAPRL